MRDDDAPGANQSFDDTGFGLDLSIAVFDRAARLAQSMFTFAGASIILVHEGKVWRSKYARIVHGGDPVTERVLRDGKSIWVDDTLRDPLVAGHPMVVGPPFLRFSVAVPIRLQDGSIPGVLGVSGTEPQRFDAEKLARLNDIADFVADEWTRAHAVSTLKELLHERDKALERSARSEERLNLALELAQIHVWELDYELRELFKAGAEDTFFTEPHTYKSLHKDIYAAIDPRDRAAVQAAWEDHIKNGSNYRPEYRINRTDGREVWTQSSIKLLGNYRGGPARMVGALQNITDRKRSEQALIAAKQEADTANKFKTEFLASMSHELRTPLNAILGFAEIIKDQVMGPAPERYVGYARDIYESGHHLLDLVNDILDISKLEAGKVDLHDSEVDIHDLLDEVVALFGKQAEVANVSILSSFGLHQTIRADKRLLKQVLLNLLSNALKFTPGGGTVSVTVTRAMERGMTISVSDTGIGMTSDEIEIALSPFGQIESKIAQNHKGTGLGLPIARGLMRLHGGDLLVDSEPERGTSVTMVLPDSRIVSISEPREAS